MLAGDKNSVRLRDAAVESLLQADCEMIPGMFHAASGAFVSSSKGPTERFAPCPSQPTAVYADPALNERCYGSLQGLSKVIAEETFGKATVATWRRSYDTRPPDGESLADTAERSVRFFEEYIVPRLAEGNNCLVVAHGNVLRCIIAHIASLTEEDCLRCAGCCRVGSGR